MKSHLASTIIAGWALFCLAFFVVGESYLDPSGQYGLAQKRWFSILQWLALISPIFVTWAVVKFLTLSPKNHDAEN